MTPKLFPPFPRSYQEFIAIPACGISGKSEIRFLKTERCRTIPGYGLSICGKIAFVIHRTIEIKTKQR
jgi:hypothetical protein